MSKQSRLNKEKAAKAKGSQDKQQPNPSQQQEREPPEMQRTQQDRADELARQSDKQG
ncbi:MAG TPA: hypothetical protein VMZ74_09950 [Ramlibacter sp.]|nr:hypothetical protein [Ramlibacter sp.]